MKIEHIYPHYDELEARKRVIQELNAHLSIKLYNKRKLEEKQKKKSEKIDDS